MQSLINLKERCNTTVSSLTKNAFQWDAYRPLVDRMCVCVYMGMSTWEVSARGVCQRGCLPGGGGMSAQGSVCPGGICPEGCLPRMVCHVTYPIVHLMLPVCCLHTNSDPVTVQLLINCWLVM